MPDGGSGSTTRPSALIALLAALVGGTSCSDWMTTPNTDVGIVVWVDVTPAAIRLTDTSEIVVRLRMLNPGDEEIRVRSGGPPYRLTPDPAQSRGLWGSIRFASESSPFNAGPGADYWGDSVYVFGPRAYGHNAKRYRLQQWATGGWTLRPGELRIRGWFNGREGRSATLTILPP